MDKARAEAETRSAMANIMARARTIDEVDDAVCVDEAIDALWKLREKVNNGNPYIFCRRPKCCRGAGHSGPHATSPGTVQCPVVLLP